MAKEIGPRERALREMREAKFARKPSIPALKAAINVATKKQGKPRKGKK